MNITSAKYLNDIIDDTTRVGILVTDDTSTKIVVPIDSANSDYQEILRQVAEGTLTIADAD